MGGPIGEVHTRSLYSRSPWEVRESVYSRSPWEVREPVYSRSPWEVREPARWLEPEQIRSSTWERARGAVQNQDEYSRAIDSRCAKIPGQKLFENTIDPGSVPHLHPRGPFQRNPDVNTTQAHPY